MAVAPGHRLGQIIGDTLEEAVKPVLQSFAARYNLFLDFKGNRPARQGLKCTWIDGLGNSHDLDFVLERGGDESEVGLPAAFIEIAWRRYTKHSRAKAQEIQGAVLPLLAKFETLKPFAGAVVAGDWTDGALNQLRSSGFAVLHIKFQEVVSVFAKCGIDVAAHERTSDEHLANQVAVYDALSPKSRAKLASDLRATAPTEFEKFERALKKTILRSVTEVVVLPLYGSRIGFPTVAEAIAAMRDYEPKSSPTFDRFEIQLRYTNGDEVRASFQEADDAIEFLDSFR